MAGGGSFTSDQTTLQMDTASVTLLRAGRARVTSIQVEGIAGSQLLLHDSATTAATAGSNLKATDEADVGKMYRVMFADCFEYDVCDDELLISPEDYSDRGDSDNVQKRPNGTG